jgi:nitroreductase
VLFEAARWAPSANNLQPWLFARKKNPETGAPIRTAQFDTGAAWQSLALQAHKLGLSTRAMGGIHHEKTYELLGVPEADYESMIGIAVGYPGERESLPPALHERELPNQRRSVREFAFEGRFPAR